MKKLFLLLSAGITALSAGAQVNNSMLFTNHVKPAAGIKHTDARPLGMTRLGNAAHKTTDAVDSTSWFSFEVAGDDGSTAKATGFPTFPDSTAYVPAGDFYWWCHGMGTSLDPTSVYFSDLWQNPDVTAPPFKITKTNPYSVDSIEVVGFYNRINTTHVDTLYIDVAVSSTLRWVNSLIQSEGIAETDTLHVADPAFDWANNRISSTVTPMYRIQIVLNDAVASDTLSNGLIDTFIALPGKLNVPAGGKVVAYTHFASGYAYPFGADLDTLNDWYAFTYDLKHTPLQKMGDYNGGLMSTTDERYNTANSVGGGGTATQYLLPAYFESLSDGSGGTAADQYIHDPYYNFHIACASCVVPAAVGNVAKTEVTVNAYPNPATSKVNVSVSLSAATNVNVTLANMLGQVVATNNMGNTKGGVATFSTTALPDGIYVYTVEANGQKTTGRVTVAH